MGIQCVFSLNKAKKIIKGYDGEYVIIGDGFGKDITLFCCDGKAVGPVNHWGDQRGVLLPLLERNGVPYKEV